jgi:hypothetical protein
MHRKISTMLSNPGVLHTISCAKYAAAFFKISRSWANLRTCFFTDYLITSFSYTTATGLSGLVDNAISHDPVTRFLSQQGFTSKELGKVIKKTVREIETGEGVCIAK